MRVQFGVGSLQCACVVVCLCAALRGLSSAPFPGRSRGNLGSRWQNRSREHSCRGTTEVADDHNPPGLKGGGWRSDDGNGN